jgi:three-Cys-motif partner protein
VAARRKKLELDHVGYWSEIKLDIIREYAAAYSRILSAQERPPLHHVYVDAFAGAGVHISKTTGKEVSGSPVIAAETKPPFREYHFIDLDGLKVENLRKLFAARPDVFIHAGNCNEILMRDVLPHLRWHDYRRALCILDPYGLHLDWSVIREAGKEGSIEIFLNFPIADMNRNVFWHRPDGVADDDIARMNAFWGDESWRKVVYKPAHGLFELDDEKQENQIIAEAFRQRLRDVAGFRNVPEPIPMRNTKHAIVYYLFFASQKPVAGRIVSDIFNKYRDRGADVP